MTCGIVIILRCPVNLGGHLGSHLRNGIRVTVFVAETLALRRAHSLRGLPNFDPNAILETRLLLREAIDNALNVAG